ncbi:hypothetical protein TNCV_2111571 [Trichonephila clavipes]|nr:hypothetical protein TNCV_2111571 [Trichonephila clavipes]
MAQPFSLIEEHSGQFQGDSPIDRQIQKPVNKCMRNCPPFSVVSFYQFTVGSLVVRASDPDRKAWGSMPDAPPNTFQVHTVYVLVKSVGPKVLWLNHECRGLENTSSPSIPCLNCGAGNRWCRRLSSIRGISPSLIRTVNPIYGAQGQRQAYF